MKKSLFCIVTLILAVSYAGWRVHAQNITANMPMQFTATGVHLQCLVTPPTIPAHTDYCPSGDGFWQSTNGGPWMLISPSSPVVAGVQSVNGKTGVVVLSLQ